VLSEALSRDVKVGGMIVGEGVEGDVVVKGGWYIEIRKNGFPRALGRTPVAVDTVTRIDE
jgi:hypothetical protein